MGFFGLGSFFSTFFQVSFRCLTAAFSLSARGSNKYSATSVPIMALQSARAVGSAKLGAEAAPAVQTRGRHEEADADADNWRQRSAF